MPDNKRKLTIPDVKLARAMRNQGFPYSIIAKHFEVSVNCIVELCKGWTYKDVSR